MVITTAHGINDEDGELKNHQHTTEYRKNSKPNLYEVNNYTINLKLLD